MDSDAVFIGLFCLMAAGSCVTAAALWIADSVCHRPLPIRIPSLYGPIAKLAFHPNRKARGAFRFWFSKLYRKRFWNPTLGALVKIKGFDRKRHLQAANMHAACSVLVLSVIVVFLHFAHKASLSGQWGAEHTCLVFAAGMAAFELVFNAPAIVLSRYLYRLTFRKRGLKDASTADGGTPASRAVRI
ncbi:MAG TPA: hypothetical protein VL361_15670 [Candidatus Limnocylindrales bacterium]|jgi:hypothetical protein|nr:hypothetical protein [Candidatus Limnocylindrales bacterium]